MKRRERQSLGTSTNGAAVEEACCADGDFWNLRLYVAGATPRAERALVNLTRLCESHLRGQYSIEVIDLLLDPKLARDDQIVALPTLVRRLPPPIKKVIGDLSDVDRIRVGLELRDLQVPR